jgi:hypothetical protein
MSIKLYAVILTTEDYINTVIFDNEKEAVDSFDCIDYNVVDDYDNTFAVVAELDGLGKEFGFGARGDFHGGNIIKQK